METNLRRLFCALVMCFVVLGYCPVFQVHGTNNSCDYKDHSYRLEYEKNIFVSLEDMPCTQPKFLIGVAVSENGQFLTVFSYGNLESHIELYDSNGCFLKRYVFQNAGTILADFADTANNIDLYLIREHIVITIDSDGQYVSSMEDWETTQVDSQLYAFDGYSKTVKGNNYKINLKNKKKEFTVTASNGEIVYQCMLDYKNSDLQNYLAPVVSSGILVVILITIFRKKRTAMDDSASSH